MGINSNKKIILLAGDGVSTNAVFHAVNSFNSIQMVLMEEKENTKTFLKKRVKKLGFFKVVGQVLFQIIIIPVLHRSSSKYIRNILQKENINSEAIPADKIKRVPSINNAVVIDIIQKISPDVVIVNGTRIISKKILSAINCPVINMHAGITPHYRGVHGGYWALVNNDAEHCGVTIHLVDTGVDTGDVLHQAVIVPEREDNFTTYPLKQLIAGIPLLLKAIEEAITGSLKPYKPEGISKQWYHPTFWEYICLRIAKNVK